MKHLIFLLLFTSVLRISLAQPTISLQQYVPGFSNPVDIANCGDERLFIVEQDGYIRIINEQGNIEPQAFLDINGRVGSGGERGLLGLAFHPDYKDNGYFYVNYTDNNGNTVVSRFSVTGDPNLADAASESAILNINQPYSNHNGGNIEFGPDYYLYIGMGDGGSGGDPQDYAQNPQSLLGKMLRIDIDTTASYKIPSNNPFVNDPGVDDRIWALGLRNPWRFSFDRLTGDLWTGDVGQGAKEEIDFQPASSAGGENYGWKCYEGNNFYANSTFGCSSNYTFPVFDYARSLGLSVTGGYVYRGCKYPDLFGHYVFCDYGTGNFWTIENLGGGNFQATAQQQSSSYRYVSFGEDMNGELYVAGLNGTIYRVTETTTAATLPTIVANPGTSLCPGDSVTLSTQPGYAVYWELNSSTLVGIGLQINVNTPGNYTLTATGNNGCVYTTPTTTVTAVPAPTPVITANDTAFCPGDSLQLTTGNFNTYQWSDGSTASSIFVKQAGIYYVIVTDSNGCTGTVSSSAIAENPLPVPVIQQSGYLCNGNTATLSSDSYASYLWSTLESTQQISVSQPGTYDVTVTDINGCSGISTPVTIADNQLPQPLIYSSKGAAFCEGDSTDLFTAFTGASHLWSTGATEDVLTASQAGDYSVTVTDSNGCSGISDTLVLNTFPLPSPEILPGYDVKQCGDGVIELTTLAAYTDYNWSRGDTTPILFVISNGIFNVTVVDSNGCMGVSDSASVEFIPSPPIPQISGGFGNFICLDSGYHYQWYFYGNPLNPSPDTSDFVHSPADTLQTFTPGIYGYNFVIITDHYGCSSTSEIFWDYEGIEETWIRKINIQPNPFTSEIVLNYELNDLANLQIRLLDLTGKEISTVLNEKQGAGSHSISIAADKPGLSAGVYFIEMQSGILRKTFKVVKM